MAEKSTGDFLPEKEDLLSKHQPAKPGNLKQGKLNESELINLGKSAETREKDLKLFGPALDDINTLKLSDQELASQLEIKAGAKETLSKKVAALNNNILQALRRELVLLPADKIKELFELKELLKKISDLKAPADLSVKQAVILLRRAYSAENLDILKKVFSQRYNQLYHKQKKHIALSELYLTAA